jgi:hypothetical protein
MIPPLFCCSFSFPLLLHSVIVGHGICSVSLVVLVLLFMAVCWWFFYTLTKEGHSWDICYVLLSVWWMGLAKSNSFGVIRLDYSHCCVGNRYQSSARYHNLSKTCMPFPSTNNSRSHTISPSSTPLEPTLSCHHQRRSIDLLQLSQRHHQPTALLHLQLRSAPVIKRLQNPHNRVINRIPAPPSAFP